MPTITSGSITLLDLTDNKQIDLHISSNHPTVQVYDQNASQNKYNPDWSVDPLELTPIVYVDSEDVTDSLSNNFTWTKIKSGDITEETVSTSKTLIISTNALSEAATIRYKCIIEYNGRSFSNEITFARVDTGKNGESGNSAPEVKAQYSVDGTSDWTTTLDSSTHKYIRFSYDDGATWTSAIKIAGEDGKSVQIKGVAYAQSTPVSGQTIILYSDENTSVQITNGVNGDSYLVDGYLCVYNGTNFVCTGQIQGPPGAKGDSYYLFIRYASDANGTGMSTSPNGKSYVGFYRSSIDQVPTSTSATIWNWAKFVGEDAKMISLTGSAQAFKVDKSNIISPATIKVTAQVENTSVTSWTYSIDGGTTFTSSAAGVSRSGNIVTITGSAMTANSIAVKATDGTHSDTFTVYKVSDGTDGQSGEEGAPAPIAFLTNENISFSANANGQITGTTVYCNVVAYRGTTKVTPTIGTILSSELPSGMSIGTITTVSDELLIPIVIANNATLGSDLNLNGTINIPVTSPVVTNLKITWSKINSGASGSSASLVDVTPSALYFKSTKGKNGTFTPEFIYLYPRFQNAVYSNWQYSVDGGINWVSASGANGLTIGTYSTVQNALRISRTSSLYTDTITSISFKCNSLTSDVYDTVSIAKIYDVVDLTVGARNLLHDSTFNVGTNWQKTYGTILEPEVDKPNSKIYHVYHTRAADATAALGTPIYNNKRTYISLKAGESLTVSYDFYTSDIALVGDSVSTLRISTAETGGTVTSLFTSTKAHLINQGLVAGKWQRFNYTYTTTTDLEGWLIFGLYIRAEIGATVSYKFREIKVEKGNKNTDWTPAPEDVDANIEKVDTRLTNSLSEVKTTIDSITSRVSATETSITTTNNNVTSLTDRVSAAEQKITPTAIVSTVRQSTEYTNDLGKKVSTNEIISKINQTAESITISANKIGLLGATNIPNLTADKIKGGTLTLGGTDATTQNGQILVKNASNADMISINQYGMAITDGNLMIVNESELNDYGGWSSHSHTELKTTGIKSMYIGANSNSEYHAELDAIGGLTMQSMGGLNANPYYLHIGPTMDDVSDYGTEMLFYENLVMRDGTIDSDTNENIIANISLNEVVLPKANIVLQDTAQKNIMFQNASKELRTCMLYAGANDSTTVMGLWDTTKSKAVLTYTTDNKLYILDSEAVTKTMMQNSIGERGYQKLPSGLIIQWGYQGSALTASGNANLTTGNITLPIAFPTSFTGVFCNIIEVDSGSLSGYYNLTAKANGLTGFTWKAYNYFNNWGSSILFSWFAIGY